MKLYLHTPTAVCICTCVSEGHNCEGEAAYELKNQILLLGGRQSLEINVQIFYMEKTIFIHSTRHFAIRVAEGLSNDLWKKKEMPSQYRVLQLGYSGQTVCFAHKPLCETHKTHRGFVRLVA